MPYRQRRLPFGKRRLGFKGFSVKQRFNAYRRYDKGVNRFALRGAASRNRQFGLARQFKMGTSARFKSYVPKRQFRRF